jgi:hypothetical protein
LGNIALKNEENILIKLEQKSGCKDGGLKIKYFYLRNYGAPN